MATTQQEVMNLIRANPTRVIYRRSFNPFLSVKLNPVQKDVMFKDSAQSLSIYGITVNGEEMTIEVSGDHEMTVEQVCEKWNVEGGSQGLLDAIGAKSNRIQTLQNQKNWYDKD